MGTTNYLFNSSFPTVEMLGVQNLIKFYVSYTKIEERMPHGDVVTFMDLQSLYFYEVELSSTMNSTVTQYKAVSNDTCIPSIIIQTNYFHC